MSVVKAFILAISPASTHPKHWFLSADQHALEYTVQTFAWFSLLMYTLYVKGRNRKPVFYSQKNEIKPIEHLFGLTLATCLLIQSTYNVVMRPIVGIVIMLHPCHIISVLELYLIYGKNSLRKHQIFNLVIYYTFYTLLALLVPDTSSLYLPVHKVVFWVQHWLVYLLPFYFVLAEKFVVDHRDSFYFFVGVSLSNLYFWNIEFPVSLATSININYTLWPSAGGPAFASGKNYRTLLCPAFALLLGVHGYIVPAVVQQIAKVAGISSSASKVKAKQK